MFLSANAFFNDGTQNNIRLLVRAETAFPEQWLAHYKKNVVDITPLKTGALRRSIITRTIPSGAEVSWRVPYAAAQNAGQHTVNSKRVVNIDGKFVTLQPGIYHYKNNPGGGGPHFASRAFVKTNNEMPAVLRELGLTK